MASDYAKGAPIPRGYIHYLSFEPNLTNIFKYLHNRPAKFAILSFFEA